MLEITVRFPLTAGEKKALVALATNAETADCHTGPVEVEVYTSESAKEQLPAMAAVADNATMTFAEASGVGVPTNDVITVNQPDPVPFVQPTETVTPEGGPITPVQPTAAAVATATGVDMKEQLRSMIAAMIGEHGPAAINAATEVAMSVCNCSINDVPNEQIPSVMQQLQAKFEATTQAEPAPAVAGAISPTPEAVAAAAEMKY